MAKMSTAKRLSSLAKKRSKTDFVKKRRSVRSVDLGPKIVAKVASTNVHFQNDGFVVKGNSMTLGRSKKISPIVSKIYPSHRFMYFDSGVTNVTGSGVQDVTLISPLMTNRINDSLTKIKDLMNENAFMTLANTTGNGTATTSTNTGNPLVVNYDTSAQWAAGHLNKMYLESAFFRLRLSNNVDVMTKVEVLPILCKQQVSTYIAGSGVVQATANDPKAFWTSLVIAQQTQTNLSQPQEPSAFQIDLGTVGLRPYDKKYKRDFEKFYKCLTPMKFTLNPGQQTSCIIKHNIFREMKAFELNDYINCEGVTLYFMIFTEGMLVGSTTTGSVTTLSTCSTMWALETHVNARVTQFSRGYTVQLGRFNRGLDRFSQNFVDAISGDVDNDGVDFAETA